MSWRDCLRLRRMGLAWTEIQCAAFRAGPWFTAMEDFGDE